MQTSPQYLLYTLMHCCLHSQTMISFNVGGKCRFCDWNATFDASICFAAMVTKSRRRRKQERAWKQEQGESDDQLGIIKKNRMKVLSSCRWHIQRPPCQAMKRMSVKWEYCRYIHQHQLCLFVFNLQVSVILVQRHNKLTAGSLSVHTPGDVLHFKAGLTYRQAWAGLKQYKVQCGGKKMKIKVYILIKRSTYVIWRLLKRCLINFTLMWQQFFWRV